MRKLNLINLSFLFFSIASLLFVVIIDAKLISLIVFPVSSIFLSNTKLSKLHKRFFEMIPLFVFILLIAFRSDLFTLIAALLISSMSAKYVISTNSSDYFEIFVVGVMLSILSSIGTISISFGFSSILFLVSSFFFLLLTQFQSTKTQNIVEFQKYLPHLKDLFVFFLLSLSLTIFLFYTVPRISFGVIRGNPLTNRATSNFSTDVEINSSPVDLDYTIVMRIEKERSPYPIYISGLRYATFINGRWLKSEIREKIYPSSGGYFGNIGESATIFLEPLNTDVIFKIDYSTGIFGDFRYINKDNLSNLYFDAPYFRTIKYTSFYTTKPLQEKLSNEELKKYLDLRTIDEKVIKIAQTITEGKESNQSKIESILKYLKENNTYSLTPNTNSIEDFILNHKSGYCEHFATAFVILARANGIPARLVSGFVTTEWNDTLKYYIVRAKDAHTWVEVYQDGKWITVDPTPTVQSQTTKLSMLIDSIKMFWYKSVVTYNVESQIKFFGNISNTFENFGKIVFNALSAIEKNILYIILVLLLFGIAYPIINRRNKKNYILRKILRLIGGEKFDSETLLEYARRYGKQDELKEIIFLYYEYRFAKAKELEGKIIRLIQEKSK